MSELRKVEFLAVGKAFKAIFRPTYASVECVPFLTAPDFQQGNLIFLRPLFPVADNMVKMTA